ncbi:amino acid ABC transporter substrate-binding protein, PAAT family [Oceanobacillus limi]|uniref:Amino acid ABC transporter substrate-binding protein, PAAT family n=1 Tax=Oceanobacillus limi TaxID=930131 RepID=A0A1I0FGF3_9BACI|nr:amino acid ABC transporter substrate-binding protein [Oceanobacillus limi]SET57185.1 amino acid ABC transporter substrate-binding protein, PAAT family [Oceanobacillus limi]
MKKIIWIFALTLIVGACGTDSENAEDNAKNEGNVDTDEPVNLYEKIMDEGVISVGTEGTYAPFTFHNEEDELTGYDVEVIQEVTNRIGIEVDFMETQWDSMFAGLNSGRFDVIANQVGIREDRLANYDFSVPYTISSAVVVVPEDNTDIKSFEDLEGKNSAQSLTSNYGEIAEEHGAELVGVEGLAQAIELMKQGRVDVTVNDRLAVLDYMQAQPDAGIKIVARSDDASENAFAFRKDNEELVEAFNDQLEAMKEDGTLAEISEKWFGEDVSE